MVTSQSYEGLGADAARLVGAAWATIAFQCTDPEPIAARAGTVKEVQINLQAELTAVPGRNTLMSGKEYLSGTFMQHEQEVPQLHPNVIRNLGIGECCIITNGAYMELRVARLPEMPDMGMLWGKAASGANISSSLPPRRSTSTIISAEPLAVGAILLDEQLAAADGAPTEAQPNEELELIAPEAQPDEESEVLAPEAQSDEERELIRPARS